MKKFRILAALCAAFLLIIPFSTVAYAGGGEETTEAVTESAVETEAEANPFTPAGTGTVIDTATDGDGKEFYTIMTPDENVFYLIIDKQRETENVYFLNAVTERDLLALAEKSEDTGETVSAIPDNTTPAVTEPEPEAETPTEPETASGGNGSIIVVVLIVLAAGGAGYYFKIYRPKQQQADSEEDYDYEADEADPYGEDTEPEDGDPAWYEDGDESGGDGEE